MSIYFAATNFYSNLRYKILPARFAVTFQTLNFFLFNVSDTYIGTFV